MRGDVKIEAPELRLDPALAEGPLPWSAVFPGATRIEVEIGIGKGRFLLAAAADRPESGFLGVEWANQYLRIAERRALRRGLRNVRFLRVDARQLVCEAIASASVSAYYVFYPDPWPKKRHHKRRFLQPAVADHLGRTLTPGGLLHVATDHRDYWEQIEPLFDRHGAFERCAEFGGSEFPLPVDAPLTNFEEKYRREGRDRFRGSWRRMA